jgi:hypothetical protein
MTGHDTSEHKSYLGDSVYVDIDQYGGLILTTENGLGAPNSIVMEPEVIHKLSDWINQMQELQMLRTSLSPRR